MPEILCTVRACVECEHCGVSQGGLPTRRDGGREAASRVGLQNVGDDGSGGEDRVRCRASELLSDAQRERADTYGRERAATLRILLRDEVGGGTGRWTGQGGPTRTKGRSGGTHAGGDGAARAHRSSKAVAIRSRRMEPMQQ